MTRLRLDIRPAADRDIAAIAEYLAAHSIHAAIRFLAATRRALEFLTDNPSAGAAYPLDHPRLTGLRKWSIKGYRKYLIFYVASANAIQVVRVIHGARDLPTLLADE